MTDLKNIIEISFPDDDVSVFYYMCYCVLFFSLFIFTFIFIFILVGVGRPSIGMQSEY